jgi:hypothetical protein
VFGAQARFRARATEIKGHSHEYVRVGDEGSRATFHFCPHCGATVYWGFNGHKDVIAVAVGAFADPGFPQPTVSVYEERKHVWVDVPEEIEHLR